MYYNTLNSGSIFVFYIILTKICFKIYIKSIQHVSLFFINYIFLIASIFLGSLMLGASEQRSLIGPSRWSLSGSASLPFSSNRRYSLPF
jgi:hypothetical protein